jgi:hypothetical protein
LIANGDFRWWSRLDANGQDVDSEAPDQIDYTFSVAADDIENDEHGFAADGWQFTRREFAASSDVVSRVTESGGDGAIDTSMQFVGAASGGGTPGINEIEYRVDVQGEWAGSPVTFAVDYDAPAASSISVAVVTYTRDALGALSVQSRKDTGVTTATGTARVVSAALTAQTYAIGFIVRFGQGGSARTWKLRQARAAIGSFPALPYTRLLNARDVLRRYYETGRAVLATSATEGDAIATSAQFGAIKASGLSGTGLRARTRNADSEARSGGVTGISMSADAHSLTIEGVAAHTGSMRIDVDWECEVIYGRGS